VNESPTTVACTAGPGDGGLGRHFAEVLDALENSGTPTRFYAPSTNGRARGVVVTTSAPALLAKAPPGRWNRPLAAYLDNALFDRAVARALEPGSRHVGFAGHSLLSFRRAAAAGAELVLVSPTAHVQQTSSLYERAFGQHPIERAWLGKRLVARTVREYEVANRIQVASEYVRESFLEAGVPPERLERVELTVDQRFRPVHVDDEEGSFRIVYVGGLTVAKGVPVLLDAFRRLPLRRAALTLVGGWSSRGMRRHVQRALSSDRRIRIASGDPLLELQRADVYVHPSFQEGFGYAPMEALACGVPVVVTEHTGMKDHVRQGVNGYTVPSGDVDALVERLLAVSAGALTAIGRPA
jgi:glycosyltransferase involved in cell wall biosynthesis